MIPPRDGSPMADPPPWHDQVIDLSLDEARGLMEMGVRVYRDYGLPPPRAGWHYRPCGIIVSCTHEIKASEFYTRLYHIRKEDA